MIADFCQVEYGGMNKKDEQILQKIVADGLYT